MSKRDAMNPLPDWQTLTPAERNAAYNNGLHVGLEFAQKKRDEWAAASAILRQQHPQHLDLAYAPRERTRWDLYPASAPNAPCFVHIHGGYWQRGGKEAFACLAEGVLAHGWSAALPGYTLAPEASLTQIVQEMRDAFDWLAANRRQHGITGPVILTGWSAGGHLAALLTGHPGVSAALAVSGVFDLGHLRDSPHVNDALQFTDEEVRSLSPMRLMPAEKRLDIAYGSAELPHMIAASRDYHAYRAHQHLPGDLIPVPHADHMTALDEFRKPDGLLTRAMLRLANEF
jgi:acetyl esterase/lipase